LVKEDKAMMFEIFSKGVELLPNKLPHEWDERTVMHLEEETLTLTFKAGNASVTKGDTPDAGSIIKLTGKRLCDAIDGTTDFMKVWMELAEPPDNTTVQKGSGAKLVTLIDLLSNTYRSNPEFKKLLDDYKSKINT
jgi:hypothetical protein